VVDIGVAGDQDDVESVDARRSASSLVMGRNSGWPVMGSTRSKTGRSTPVFSSKIRFADIPTNSVMIASMTM